MRIRFQVMFSLSMNVCHDLHTSLHLVRFLLSKSSNIFLPTWGNLANIHSKSIFDKTYTSLFWITSRVDALWGKRWKLRSSPTLTPSPSGCTQRIQHVSLVNVVAATWTYSCLVLAAGGSVTGQRNKENSMIQWCRNWEGPHISIFSAGTITRQS